MMELLDAVDSGDFETFKAIVDSKLYDNFTCIEVALYRIEDDPKWIEYCEPFYVSNTGVSFLNNAVCCNQPNVVISMLKRGALVNHRSRFSGDTPIDCARSKQLVKILIEHGSDIPRNSLTVYAQFATDAINARDRIRHRAIITLGANRCRSRYRAKGGFADVLQIIARCVWSARLSEFVWD
jgi:hypothetical protein